MMTVLEPDLMRTLATLADEGSFTKAGERLGLTQQAISAQIKRIESAINRQVVSRRGVRLRLTQDGETLLAYARQAFDISRRVQRHFENIRISGLVRIGLTEGFVVDGLPLLLTSLRGLQPSLELVVECGHTEKLLLRQENGKLDLVLGIQRVGGSRGDPLWTDKPEWVGDVSLFTSHQTVRLATLPEPSLMRKLAIEALTRQGVPYQVVFESENRSSIRAAALSGLGVALFCRTLDTDIDFHTREKALPDIDPVEFFMRVMDRTDSTTNEVAKILREATPALRGLLADAPPEIQTNSVL